eukprot:CAMPEP_0177175056 /NCGR_PEP_ID=MMETSP0367-20130122/12504_1 /TAXON_ID=447022 ORGANISM="Scrippsiella hangoei-like, Strain SHHI-4" /NCGR_SAMPLE_ID=MMETSP0367 /ASSEMBLY_ACC=CAM_ASM_000362 /LENGTH=89 /DNA_ID=CAMNT_0018621447 /DNA_START=222 /DNA_END=487 /DNA_ORIENTATION=+
MGGSDNLWTPTYQAECIAEKMQRAKISSIHLYLPAAPWPQPQHCGFHIQVLFCLHVWLSHAQPLAELPQHEACFSASGTYWHQAGTLKA